MDHSFPSTIPKRSEKDEKAISEIYKTLVTSFNPGKRFTGTFNNRYTFLGPSSLDLPIDNSPFSKYSLSRRLYYREWSLGSITGDFLFAANSPMSMPPNRTVNNDPSLSLYRQQQQHQQATYSYQPPQPRPPSNVSIHLSSHSFFYVTFCSRILNIMIVFQWTCWITMHFLPTLLSLHPTMSTCHLHLTNIWKSIR